jgi:hypothetical protein
MHDEILIWEKKIWVVTLAMYQAGIVVVEVEL